MLTVTSFAETTPFFDCSPKINIMYVLTRPYDGITINDARQILRYDDAYLLFKLKKEAKTFLQEKGLEADIEKASKEEIANGSLWSDIQKFANK